MTLLAEGFVGRFEEYFASIEGFNCEGRDDSNFVLEDEFMIEFMIAVSGGLSRGDDESRWCIDKELACDSNEFVTA